jgi:hypothetical protein
VEKHEKNDIKAKKPDLLDEVYRRCKGEDLPKADNWPVKKCISELEKNAHYGCDRCGVPACKGDGNETVTAGGSS